MEAPIHTDIGLVPWNLFMHFQVSPHQSYSHSFSQIMQIQSGLHLAQLLQYVPSAGILVTPHRKLRVHGRFVTAYSLFRNHVVPEWEHPTNCFGFTLTARIQTFSPSDTDAMWRRLVCDCTRGAMDFHVVGIQLAQRWSRHNPMLKLDVWVSQGGDAEVIRPQFDALFQRNLQLSHVPRQH